MPLTFSDKQGPIGPVARSPPASPVIAAQRTPTTSRQREAVGTLAMMLASVGSILYLYRVVH